MADEQKPKTRRRKEREALQAKIVEGAAARRANSDTPRVNTALEPVDLSSHAYIASLTTVEQRVGYIARRMSLGDWLGGYGMRCDLGALWGVTEGAVKSYASEAHRVLALDPAQREELRNELGLTCKAILAEAKALRNSVTGLPDWRAALEASAMVAKFAGIELEQPAVQRQDQRVEIVVLTEAEAKPEEPKNNE